MKTYKKWTLFTITLTAFILFAVALLNYFVDPYGYYLHSRKSYNHSKLIESDPYQFKAYQSKKYQLETIVLGTSRAMRLNPLLIKSLTGESTYNLGLSAANPYINLRYLQYLIKVDKNLDTVFLGLDFEVFDHLYVQHASFVEKRLNSPFYMEDLFSTLLSEKAFKGSIKVLIDNQNKTSTYTKNEFLDDGSFDENYVYAAATNQNTLKVIPTAYQLSSDSMRAVQQMIDLCRQNNLKLYLYISPVHAIILETFWQSSIWDDYEDWKRQLVSMAPVWDFSGYHEISMSTLQNQENYNDLSHFSKKTGSLMLYRMLNKEPSKVSPDFGVYLTTDNVEKHLEMLKLSREQWSQKGKDMFEVLDSY